MKKFCLVALTMLATLHVFAQNLLTWSPEFPTDASTLTFTVDCNKGNQGLLNYGAGNSNDVYVHIGVITNLSTSPTDWKYTKFDWGTTPALAQATALGNNKYSYTISNIRSFFNVPAGETILKVTAIFRNGNGSSKQVNSDNSDMYIPVYAPGSLQVRFTAPAFEPRYIPWLEPISASIGDPLTVTGISSSPANLNIQHNGTSIGNASNAQTLTAGTTIATACAQKIILTANNGTSTVKDSFSFYIPPSTTTAPLPAAVQDGINYFSDPTKATLVLYAPGKTEVVAIGDFSNWQTDCAFQMKRTPDGNRFFIELTGLTPGQLYRFQYLADGNIRTTDPYTELILDPNNDQYISASSFPNLPAYPTGLTTGIVGTFQTQAPGYTWHNTNFTRPDKKNLIIYELLLRDFLANDNWQTLTDTLNYLQQLGINAIELMPFNEFEGNISWGYNPDFFFAPDKAYGTKNNLKRFIDSAHGRGIAVIMDAVLNHATGLSPLAQLYWNSATNQPAANSPYFNPTATHPFNVFNDFNHASEATKYHTARFIRHWLEEYKLDGFRWDLSKGFTQTVTTDVNTWNAYDASRVAIWQRYYDSTQVVSPGSYQILEHLGNDDEESDLASRGMLLWGKMTEAYNQNTMGYAGNSDISRAFFKNRPGWNDPHLVTYAESHDEERIMYKNLTFGNASNSAHDVKNLTVALKRTEAMQPFLLLIPGPKMIWQFGELGYDKSIFQCEDGTVPQPYGTDNCKTNPKPILWNYLTEPARKNIYRVIAKLNHLRAVKPNAFLSHTISGNLGNDLKKTLIINHPDLQLVALGNFDVTAQDITVTFPSAGTWYNYFTGETFTTTGNAQTINLTAGDYRVYTNISFCNTDVPVVSSPVSYCVNETAVPLTATGTGLMWYTTATGGTGTATAPTPSTATVGTTVYYVSQTTGCESGRTAIEVIVYPLPPAPTATTSISYCLNATAQPLTATGTNLLWYTTATGGTGSSTAPTPSTSTLGTTTYYLSQQPNDCESERLAITVTITSNTAPPTVNSPVQYCQFENADPLTANGTNLLWYTTATGGTGSATAPTVSTQTIGTTTYYVSQTQNCGESERAVIEVQIVSIPPMPTVSDISYCEGQTAVALTATGSNLLWYTTAIGGNGSANAPTPSTASAGTMQYYVSQTTACESERAEITVHINALPAPPTATSSIEYCQGETAVALTANGTSLLWYEQATGGNGSATAPIPSTAEAGTFHYYVAQINNGCESERTEITVTVAPLPEAPAVHAMVSYCQHDPATALTTVSGQNLQWYNVVTGGTGSTVAPIPNTSIAGTSSYYVSQENNCGEGPRSEIEVVVNPTPAAPTALTVQPISLNSATLSWMGAPAAMYRIEYKKQDASVWTFAAATTATTYELTNLEQGTVYDWRISSNCSPTANQNYSLGQFTTLDRNSSISNMHNGLGLKVSPNPFQDMAILDFSIQERGIVKISLWNGAGQKIQVLHEANLIPGAYQVDIGKKLKYMAAGSYFIRIEQHGKGNYIQIIKTQ